MTAVPIGVGAGGVAKKAIRRGEVLTEENFSPDTSTFVYRLRALQDSLTAAAVVGSEKTLTGSKVGA
jgi:predicted homoserine dehydrogenase-like protein